MHKKIIIIGVALFILSLLTVSLLIYRTVTFTRAANISPSPTPTYVLPSPTPTSTAQIPSPTTMVSIQPTITPTLTGSPITCTCTTPGGLMPNNGFTCTDGDSRSCSANEYCTNSSVKPSWPCAKQ